MLDYNKIKTLGIVVISALCVYLIIKQLKKTEKQLKNVKKKLAFLEEQVKTINTKKEENNEISDNLHSLESYIKEECDMTVENKNPHPSEDEDFCNYVVDKMSDEQIDQMFSIRKTEKLPNQDDMKLFESLLQNKHNSIDPSFIFPNIKKVHRDKKNMDTGRENVDTGRENLDTGRENVDTGKESVDTSRENVDTGRENVDTARESVDTARESVDTSRENVDTSRENVDTSRENVDTGRENVDTGRENVDTGRENVDTGEDIFDLKNTLNQNTIGNNNPVAEKQTSSLEKGSSVENITSLQFDQHKDDNLVDNLNGPLLENNNIFRMKEDIHKYKINELRSLALSCGIPIYEVNKDGSRGKNIKKQVLRATLLKYLN